MAAVGTTRTGRSRRGTSVHWGKALRRLLARNDAIDPGCVKTPQARERLELFFPDRPKSIAHNDLRSEIRNRKDDPFYQISTLRRFHTIKTLTGRGVCNQWLAAQSSPSVQTASGVQLRRRRASRFSVVSPSKFVAASTNCDRSTSSNVFMLNTAYRIPSIMHVTIGITPHVRQT